MKPFIITIDSSCDGNVNELHNNDVDIIFYSYSDEDSSYLDDLDVNNGKKFFSNMRNGTKYSTSQLNQFHYYNFFKDELCKNKNIIHISLTEGLSGSINQARLAAKILEDEDKEAHIEIIDSLIACNGELVLLDKALELQKVGLDINKATKELKEYAKGINTYFTTTTLTYFVRGGRLSKTVGFIGNMLHINPVLVCTPNGKLKIEKPIRGKKAALNYILEESKKRVVNPEEQNLYICHADNSTGAEELKNLLLQEIHFKEVKIYQMGSIIGSHTGPGLLAIFFHGKKRGDK